MLNLSDAFSSGWNSFKNDLGLGNTLSGQDLPRNQSTTANGTGNSNFVDRMQEMFNSFYRSLQASQSSAMQAEIAAADRQNAFQRDMWQKSADFNAAQADLAYQRSQTSADKANAFTRSEREASQAWYENMDNTRYQRAMADLAKAGLNPILAYAQGGANSGSVSASSGQSAAASAASMSSSSGAKANAAAAKGQDQQMALLYARILGSLATQTISGLSSALKALF